MLSSGHPGVERLAAVLDAASADGVTYHHVGSTLQAGPKRHEASIVLGRAPDTFERAKEALRRWAAHPAIGASVYPPDAPLAVGTDVVVVLPVGPVALLVPDRIVAVVDEPDRFGFAYGTLPGHPERGEEAFLLDRLPDGEVRLTIRVEATGAWFLARVGGPVVRILQRRALRGYLRGIAQAVSQP